MVFEPNAFRGRTECRQSTVFQKVWKAAIRLIQSRVHILSKFPVRDKDSAKYFGPAESSGKQFFYRLSFAVLSHVERTSFDIEASLWTDAHGRHDRCMEIGN